MKRQEITIAVAGQRAEAFFYADTEGEKRPGLVLLTDIKGIRPVYHEQAARLADAGFAVLLPNVFFRAGSPPLFSSPFQFGDEMTMKRMGELFAALSPANQWSDASAYTECLAAQAGVRSGPMGVVGYCYTGGMALRMSAACADRIGAAASFHGGNLCTDKPESPHLLLAKIKAALYLGHADGDKSMPAEAIARLGEALKSWGGEYSNKIYEGAQHGWTNNDVPIYHPAQAEQAFSDLIDFLRATLK